MHERVIATEMKFDTLIQMAVDHALVQISKINKSHYKISHWLMKLSNKQNSTVSSPSISVNHTYIQSIVAITQEHDEDDDMMMCN